MARLVCTYGTDEGKAFSLREGVNRIGRGPDAAIRLIDKACSRDHAELVLKANYMAIEDRGSRHGTFVNGRRAVHRVRLQPGDRIDVGHTVLKVAEGEAGIPEKAGAEQAAAAVQSGTQELSESLLAARPREPRVRLVDRLFGGSPDSQGRD